MVPTSLPALIPSQDHDPDLAPDPDTAPALVVLSLNRTQANKTELQMLIADAKSPAHKH